MLIPIHRASFDPEITRILGLAYDRACETASPDVKIREALAKRIIEAARRGERKTEKLVEYALVKTGGLVG